MCEGYASKEVVNPVNITKKRITVSRIARVVFTGAVNSSPKLFGGICTVFDGLHGLYVDRWILLL